MLNSLIAKSLPFIPKTIVKTVASRYIAGESLQNAIATVQQLDSIGAYSTIDVLGEFVISKERSIHERDASLEVIQAIHTHSLPAYLSVKLTSLGLDIDQDFAYENVKLLVTKANSCGLFVRMDMENSPYTTLTLDFYKRLRKEGFTNIGIVIQAYMKRSESDILSVLEYDPDIRLCKGIYNESADIAFKDPAEIRENYKKLLRILLRNGKKTGIATHDENLIIDAENYIQQNSIHSNRYEFQMLLGVREERRNQLISAGHAMRIYVPFGNDWYGYSVRRLKENPKIAGYVFKAMFIKG